MRFTILKLIRFSRRAGLKIIPDFVRNDLITMMSSTILWYDTGRIVTIIHPLLSCKLLRKTGGGGRGISTKMSCWRHEMKI